MNRQEIATANTLKASIVNTAMGQKLNANSYKIMVDHKGSEVALAVTFNKKGQVIVKKGTDTIVTASLSDSKELKKVVTFIKAAAQHAANLVKPTKKVETKKGEKAMSKSLSVSISRVTGALKKAAWTEDDAGILEQADGVVRVYFTAKSAMIIHVDTGEKMTVPLATTTDKQLISYIQGMMQYGTTKIKPSMTKTAGLNAPKEPEATPGPGVKDSTKEADKKEADKKKDKPTPKRPVNPNKDGSTPIFDDLNQAYTEILDAENKIKVTWQQFGAKHDYSIVNLTAALFAEGQWPQRMKDGEVVTDPDGIILPAGYQSVYKAEKETGLQGIGHMCNKAARMFPYWKPENVEKREEAKLNPTVNTGGTGASSTTSEKTVEEILIQMSKLAAKLSLDDLKSWAETDASMAPIMETYQSNDEVVLDSIDMDIDLDEETGTDDIEEMLSM